MSSFLEFIHFWLKALKHGASLGWGAVGGISTLLSVVFPVIGTHTAMKNYWWFVALVNNNDATLTLALPFAFIAFLLWAPFKLHSDLLKSLPDRQASPEVTKYKELLQLIEEGEEINRICQGSEVVKAEVMAPWEAKAIGFLESVSVKVLADFKYTTRGIMVFDRIHTNPENQGILTTLQRKLVVLTDLRQEMDGITPDELAVKEYEEHLKAFNEQERRAKLE